MLLKWQVKKLGFQRLRDLLNSGIKKKVFGTFSDNYKIRQEKEKSVGRMSEKLNERYGGLRGIFRTQPNI